jgi:hypothetical protein
MMLTTATTKSNKKLVRTDVGILSVKVVLKDKSTATAKCERA